MKNIALFASGNGTNVQQIAEYFQGSKEVKVDCVVVNKKNIYVIERAKNLNIPCFYFNREDFYESNKVLNLMQERKIDYIILAGFLWLIPTNLLQAYNNKIVNIHPALLPKYGGKGMYGHHVHEAVVANKETESGITIHYANEKYDSGDIIFQARCVVEEKDSADDVAAKIHLLEKEYYPKVVESVVTGKSLNE
ncbi:MAG: phosphoribosylglycinamide formyltransferase [Bacteroidales bacterium]|nr:phosphoribosylglycinamide formyltransferase [Candidatus Scybalousia scybalohippi]